MSLLNLHYGRKPSGAYGDIAKGKRVRERAMINMLIRRADGSNCFPRVRCGAIIRDFFLS